MGVHVKELTRILVLRIVFLAHTGPTDANKLNAHVVGIRDGATITAFEAQICQHTVRLARTDAPRIAQSLRPASREMLSTQFLKKALTIAYTKIDRWGELVWRVLPDGRDLKPKQALGCFAWRFKEQYNSSMSRTGLRAA